MFASVVFTFCALCVLQLFWQPGGSRAWSAVCVVEVSTFIYGCCVDLCFQRGTIALCLLRPLFISLYGRLCCALFFSLQFPISYSPESNFALNNSLTVSAFYAHAVKLLTASQLATKHHRSALQETPSDTSLTTGGTHTHTFSAATCLNMNWLE